MEKNNYKINHPTDPPSASESDGLIALAELRLAGLFDRAPDAIKNKINHELAYGLFAVLRYAAINTLILSSLTLAVLWGSVAHPVLLAWYVATNAISLIRHVVSNMFSKANPTGASINYWLRLVLVATWAISLSWCALIWITWSNNDIQTIAFVAFILAAVAFGSYAGLGLYVQAYMSAAVPLFIGLAILFGHLALDSTILAAVTMAAILIIGMGMVASSINATHVWRNTMVLLHEHQALAREHREKSAVLSTTLHSIGDGVLTIDANGLITYINPAAERLTGCSLTDLVGKTLHPSLHLKNAADEAGAANETGGERSVNLDILCRDIQESMLVPGDLVLTNALGNAISVEVRISPLYIAGHFLEGYVITLHDVTSLRLLARDLTYQAMHDPLTGLLNRRGFEARVHEALARMRTSDIQHSLCCIDLDYFKTINDSYGHKAGDSVLQQVVLIMGKCIRDSDSFGRIGGDEFSILLYGCTLDKAKKIVGEICQAVAQHQFTWNNERISIGVSIGLVSMLSNDSLDKLNHAADDACYQAKANGRGQFCVHLRTAA